MTAGLQHDENTEDVTIAAHWNFGRARVADACNDMVVEYVTAFAGVAVIYSYSDPNGPILVGGQSGESHTTEVLMRILMFQLGPELVVDFYCTLLEIKGGLMAQHEDYWNDFYSKKGLVKSLLKILCWVLLMAANQTW